MDTPQNNRRYRQKFVVIAATFALFVSFVAGSSNVAFAAVSKEDIAVSMATLLRSARAVISDNQKLINDASKGDKGLSSDAVLAKAKSNYKKATGTDIDTIDGSTLQGELLQAELAAIGEVMDDAQAQINEKGVGLKGFLPAIFARLVTEKFREKKGTVADIKLTAPKNYVRNRANRPDKWEHDVIENQFKSDAHKKGQHVFAWRKRRASLPFALSCPNTTRSLTLAVTAGPRANATSPAARKKVESWVSWAVPSAS